MKPFLKVVISILSVGILALLYPRSEVSCPAWSVRVVDASERPVANVTVRRTCQDYSTERASHETDAVTGADGRVQFEEERNRVSLLRRWLGNTASALSEGVHAGFGRHGSVFAFGNGLRGSAVSQGIIEDWTGGQTAMNSKIVVSAQ